MPCKRGKRAIIVLAMALAACHPPTLSMTPSAETALLHLHSTRSTVPLLQELTAGFRDQNPDKRFAFQLSHSSYLAMMESSGVFNDEPIYVLTQYLAPDATYWAAPVAKEQIAIVTHPANIVPGLSSADLRAIYQGRVTNWATVGGPDLAIIVTSREPGSDTNQAFQALALGNRPSTRNARIAPSNEAMHQIVSSNPGAIGYLSLGLAGAGVRVLPVDGIQPNHDTLSTYPYVNTILIVGSEEPHGAYRDFFAWMQSPAGQRIVARHYSPLPE